jgi:hypothetical protein
VPRKAHRHDMRFTVRARGRKVRNSLCESERKLVSAQYGSQVPEI